MYWTFDNLTGAWHGSILLYLFGRSAFLDLIGRDFNGIERGVSTRLQEFWTNFIQTGTPIGARSTWSQWTKFTPSFPYHFWLRDGRLTLGYLQHRTLFWTEFLPKLNYMGSNGLGDYYGDFPGHPEQYRESNIVFDVALVYKMLIT